MACFISNDKQGFASVLYALSWAMLVCWANFFFALPVYSETLTLVVGNYPPYIDKRDPEQGRLTQIVRSYYKKIGVDLRLQWRPWARVQREIDRNNGISFGWIIDEQRQKRWHFSAPFEEGSTVLVRLANRAPFAWENSCGTPWTLMNYDRLQTTTLGGTTGYSYGDTFSQAIQRYGLTFEEAQTDLQNLRKILNQRIDLFPIDARFGNNLIQRHFSSSQTQQFHFVAQCPLFSWKYHLVCAKTNPECRSRIVQFNALLKER